MLNIKRRHRIKKQVTLQISDTGSIHTVTALHLNLRVVLLISILNNRVDSFLFNSHLHSYYLCSSFLTYAHIILSLKSNSPNNVKLPYYALNPDAICLCFVTIRVLDFAPKEHSHPGHTLLTMRPFQARLSLKHSVMIRFI